MSYKILIVDSDMDEMALWRFVQTTTDGLWTHQRPTRALETIYKLAQNGEVFDAAIIDLVLPVMSGIELSTKIREHEAIRKEKHPIKLFWFTKYPFDPDDKFDPVTIARDRLGVLKVFDKTESPVLVLNEVKTCLDQGEPYIC